MKLVCIFYENVLSSNNSTVIFNNIPEKKLIFNLPNQFTCNKKVHPSRINLKLNHPAQIPHFLPLQNKQPQIKDNSHPAPKTSSCPLSQESKSSPPFESQDQHNPPFIPSLIAHARQSRRKVRQLPIIYLVTGGGSKHLT